MLINQIGNLAVDIDFRSWSILDFVDPFLNNLQPLVQINITGLPTSLIVPFLLPPISLPPILPITSKPLSILQSSNSALQLTLNFLLPKQILLVFSNLVLIKINPLYFVL